MLFPLCGRLPTSALAAGLAALGLSVAIAPARADKIKHPTAVFAGLDKITGRIMPFDVQIDETVQFGALQVTPRVCYTRPPTEAPQTDAFVEVDDVGSGKPSDYKRIFGGWMFAASPGLHAVEHPVFDVWLTDCKGGQQVIKETPVASAGDKTPGFDEPIRSGPTPGFAPGAGVDPDAPAKALKPNAPRQRPSTASAPAALPPPVPAQPRQPTRSFFPTNSGPAREIVRD
ncbi:MAG: DUF2155 domain-containing protein [Rhodoblastus sp.]|nr:MAG: DUF2155 domain-containing protein [Rhodoblastus sp.]